MSINSLNSLPPTPVTTQASNSLAACPAGPNAPCPGASIPVTDDTGLQPITDGFIQHNYIDLPQDILDAVAQSPQMAQFVGTQSRANIKEGTNPPSGWNNVILPMQSNYVELIPESFAGPYFGQVGSAVGVQSAASATALQANAAKLFTVGSADVHLDVKDNSQPGDATVHFAPHTRQIPQWYPTADTETKGTPFSGNWVGAWWTDEEDNTTNQVETAVQTLQNDYQPQDLANHMVSQTTTLGADDMANYAKMLASAGYKLELQGAAAEPQGPMLSTLDAYLKQQEAAKATITLVARSPDKDAMVVRIHLNEDQTQQGFDEDVIRLNRPTSAPINLSFGTPTEGGLKLTAYAGSEDAVLSIQRPMAATPPVVSPPPTPVAPAPTVVTPAPTGMQAQ